MNYLMFNHDGSIKATNLVDIITQGSNTYVLYVYVEGFDPEDYGAVAKFILPDGEPTTPLIGISSTFQPDGEELTGYKIQLTAAQTLQYGNLECSIEIKDLNDNVLFTKSLTLTINKTTYVADEQTITASQYDNLVDVLASKQNRFSANNVRCYETLSQYEDDLENLSVGQICLVEISKEMKAYIKTATGYERYELGGVFSQVAYLGNLDGSVTISSLYTMAGNAPFTFRYGSMPYIGGFYRPTAGVYELEVEALGSKARFYISGSELPSTPLSTFLDSSTAFYKPYVTEDELEIDLNNKADLVGGKVPLEQLPNVGAIWGNIEGTLSNQTDLQNALNAKQNTLTFDNTPTQNSNNPVKSGGIYTSLSAKADLVEGKVPASQLPAAQSVSWGSITGTLSNQTDLNTALSGKQDTLTFDNAPTNASNNPVKSGGVYTALQGKADLVDGKVPSSQLPSYVDDVVELGIVLNKDRETIPVITEGNLEATTTISDFNSLFGTSIAGAGGAYVLAFIFEEYEETPITYNADLTLIQFTSNGTEVAYVGLEKLETGKIYISNNISYRVATSMVTRSSNATTTANNGLIRIAQGMSNPMNSQGDLIVGSTGGTPAKLAIGSNGQVLTSNGTTATWATPKEARLTTLEANALVEAGLYDENGIYNQGDLVFHEDLLYKANQAINGEGAFNPSHWDSTTIEYYFAGALADKQDKLPAVTNDRYLHTNASTGALEWSTVSSGMSNPMSAQGDIIYGGSSGTPTALAKGTAGQLLAMNSGATAPEWKTVTLPPMGTAYGDYAVAIGDGSVAGTSGYNYYSVTYGYIALAVANYSIAIGYSSSASSSYSTAIGYGATASAQFSTAIGSSSSASGSRSLAIGDSSYADATHSTALGAHAYTKIDYTVSIYGYGSNSDRSSTLLVKDPSHIFFANQDSSSTTNYYTSLSSFASGKYLADYLMEANPTVPSGTTPTSLTGLKVGLGSSSTYYSLGGSWGSITGTLANQTDLQNALDAKQNTLVSGTSIKTVNGSSLLGSGNLAIESVKTGTEGSATSVSLKFWQGTQQQYDAITTKDANTLYIVKGS